MDSRTKMKCASHYFYGIAFKAYHERRIGVMQEYLKSAEKFEMKSRTFISDDDVDMPDDKIVNLGSKITNKDLMMVKKTLSAYNNSRKTYNIR